MAVKDLVELFEGVWGESTRREPNEYVSLRSFSSSQTNRPEHDQECSPVREPSGLHTREENPEPNLPIKPCRISNETPDSLEDARGTTLEVGRSKPSIYGGPAESDIALERLELLDEEVHGPQSSGKQTTKALGDSYHVSTPATTVFSAKAPPVYLPELDHYLSSLQPPEFSHLIHDSSGMFIPMDKLAKSGKSLQDLEANSQVAPVWRNRTFILGAVVNFVLAITGSSALATFYSLQGLFNTVQMFALILHTVVPVGQTVIKQSWRQVLLGTIPNILAFNFASTLQQSLIYLLIFMAISAVLLYRFYKSTRNCKRYGTIEGLQTAQTQQSSGWSIVIVSFVLTVIYLPLSTMAIHVLVWSEDLWAVSNPYTSATSNPLNLPPLGPSNEFRDPLDFCWTTTMKKNEINWAPVIIILSIIVITFLTIWFPIALRGITSQSVPKVDRFTELGRARTTQDMDIEYHRLLSRDQNPFAFLYSGFRRGWSTYESIYLWAKFSTLLLVAVIDSNNCLFRNYSHFKVNLARQVLLLVAMLAFFIAQCAFAPFIDPIDNANEWTSRMNYVLTSAIALAVACGIPGQNALNTYVLYSVYVITYGLSIYFTVINWTISQNLVKRLSKRIDFSIDIFSPRLDISSLSIHIKRRIWQESISTLLLTNTDCAIPPKQPMRYAQSRDSEYAPYLLDFCGTPGERHVENLKILREVGSMTYHKAIALLAGPDVALYTRLADEIQCHYVGPDCFWRAPDEDTGNISTTCSAFFGNAWWIPFPPTLVMHYDSGRVVTLKGTADLEDYIRQNSSSDVQKRRRVRLTLRALEGQKVYWPHEHIVSQGNSISRCFGRRQYGAKKTVLFNSCTLRIRRRGDLVFRGTQLGSGFGVELAYSKQHIAPADVIGLNDDYDITAPLAKFFHMNKRLVCRKADAFEDMLLGYRRYHQNMNRWKEQVLSYSFLTKIYDRPLRPLDLIHQVEQCEYDVRVRQLVVADVNPFVAAYDRFQAVSQSPAATWWYIFWDDFWRRNHATIPALSAHLTDFNPYYTGSIAYRPLPRAMLESFLGQRGLYSSGAKSFVTPGLLNKIYVRLNDIVFQHTGQAIMFHIGDGSTERDMMGIDVETRVGQPSTVGTGGGTDHDNSSILIRPLYRWEGIFLDEVSTGKNGRKRLLAKLGTWFGITPNWRAGMLTSGLSLGLRLENGRFVRLDNEVGQVH